MGLIENINLDQIFKALPSASILLDLELRIVEASDEYLRVGSFGRDEIVGKYLFQAFPDNPNDAGADGVRNLRASIERVLKTGKSDLMPVQKYDIPNAESATGFEERWWKTTNAPVFGDDGLIAFILHSTVDVTASARLEQLQCRVDTVLKQSAIQTLAGGGEMGALLEAVPQILWTSKPDGSVDFYNSRWYEYTGWNFEQTRDWGWKPLLHPDDYDQAMEGLCAAIQSGSVWQNEHRLLRGSDESWRWHIVRAVPIRDEQGRILKWVGTATDIHDQRAAREEVVDILESMEEGFFSVDKDFYITNVNARHVELTKVPQEDQIGRYFFDVFPEAKTQKTKYWVEYHRAMNERVICHFEDFYAPLNLWTAVTVFPKLGGGFAAFFRDTTRDKLAVEKIAKQAAELKTLQERFHRSAKATDLGIWYCDLPFDVLNWNDEVKSHFFLKPDAHVNIDTFYECMHPDDREKTRLAIEKSIQSHGPYDTIFRTIDRHSSNFKWIRAVGWTDYDEHDRPTRFDGITLDLTDELRLEDELRALELAERSRLEQILRHTPISTALLVGPNHRFAFANANYENILLGGRRVTGQTVAEALPEAIRQGFGALLDRVYATGEAYEGLETPIDLLQPDGLNRHFFLNFRYETTRDENGHIDGVLASVIDVTEQVKARERLETSEANFRAITEATPQVVWTATPDGKVDYANNNWYTQTGLSPEETMGEKFLAAIHPDDVQNTIEKYGLSLRTLQPLKIEHRFRAADGTYRWFLTRAVPTLDENGNAKKWFGTNVDIEDQKRVAQELLTAKEDAERANSAKSAFLANMSHEIRTPLGAIMGFSDLLKNQNLTTDEVLNFVAVIERNSIHLLRVIDDILDLSKVEAGKMLIERVDFSFPELLSEFASIMGFRAREKGIEFQIKLPTKIPELLNSDPTRIRQILNNIVGNAIKFTERGRVQLAVKFVDQMLEFTVGDTGAGISESEAKKLFQVFQQADVSTTRKYGGTGLGLVLTRKLCETLGGHFELQSSQVGRGSIFVATIKVEIAENSKWIDPGRLEVGVRPRPAIAPSASILSGLKILVVEDSADNQILFNLYLSQTGASVEIANDGYDGLNNALTNNYDLILMDVQMPRMDGHEATRELRRRGFTKPIIALTAHAMTEEKDRAHESGFTDFLSKPVRSELLIAMILKHKKNGGLH